MNQSGLRSNRLKLETSGELPIILEESIEEYTLNKWKHQNRKMSTGTNRLDFESLARISTDSICPKTNFPGTSEKDSSIELASSTSQGVEIANSQPSIILLLLLRTPIPY